ncbi:MAG: OmpA family protein [Deltaproteobacteria bacterium]|nr:OmpA family protein [Candidatus Anaeroferrophillus wilburensis]MBN2889581.1 OmpA family protein [Deltaproteobacteria bacterium]
MAAQLDSAKNRYRSLMSTGGQDSFAVLMAALSMILLAFFILLYSIAVIDDQRRLAALDSLLGSFGFMPGGFSVSENQRDRLLQLPSLVSDNANALDTALRDFLVQRGIADGVTVRQLKDGVAVDLENTLLFSSGSYDLSADGEQVLLKLANLLRPVEELQLSIKGYCDAVPVKAGNPVPSNISLAALRAATVFRQLVHHGGLDPDRMQVQGFGSTGSTAGEGSATQRRVEIVIRGGAIAADQRRQQRTYRFKGFSLPITGK